MVSPPSFLNYDQANVSWGKNDWIAYVDFDRTVGGDATGYNLGELVRVRPDGTERTYFSGASPQLQFQCLFPSWDPAGERIALGGHFYDHEVHGVVNRVGICEDISAANPMVRNLNSEERIRAMVEALIPPADVDAFCTYYAEGVFGTAWSPDGEWVAYVTSFGPDWLNQILCRSRVDGTGDIEVHAAGSVVKGDSIRNPCWSPDGKSILFSRRNPDSVLQWAQDINMITPDSAELVNLSDGFPDTTDEGAAWYGV
jgi:Tol biopolymer transport system component